MGRGTNRLFRPGKPWVAGPGVAENVPFTPKRGSFAGEKRDIIAKAG